MDKQLYSEFTNYYKTGESFRSFQNLELWDDHQKHFDFEFGNIRKMSSKY